MVRSPNDRWMGMEMTKSAKSAIECPRNLDQTFFEQGFGVPKYGRFSAHFGNLASQRVDGTISGKRDATVALPTLPQTKR
jgi:hypothetical protein